MGYGVYQEGWDTNCRWAGYAVPAECDYPTCHEKIDRGLGYKCEEHVEDVYEEDENGVEVATDQNITEGCELFFCEEHRYETYAHFLAGHGKPDTEEWKTWMAYHPSWFKYRADNPTWAKENRTIRRFFRALVARAKNPYEWEDD